MKIDFLDISDSSFDPLNSPVLDSNTLSKMVGGGIA